MRVVTAVAEDEVIAAFLRAEIASDRFGPLLAKILDRRGLAESLLAHPDVNDADANGTRREVLAEHRGWGRDEEMFGGFPVRVDWFRAALTRDEVLAIRYIDWDWWLDVSGGSRLPTDAAARLRAGLVPGHGVEGHEPIAAALAARPAPPELIVVRTAGSAPLVVVEGHVRLTAYALFPEHLPDELEVFLGESPDFARWWAY
jgi:hypothetical protein